MHLSCTKEGHWSGYKKHMKATSNCSHGVKEAPFDAKNSPKFKVCMEQILMIPGWNPSSVSKGPYSLLLGGQESRTRLLYACTYQCSRMCKCSRARRPPLVLASCKCSCPSAFAQWIAPWKTLGPAIPCLNSVLAWEVHTTSTYWIIFANLAKAPNEKKKTVVETTLWGSTFIHCMV